MTGESGKTDAATTEAADPRSPDESKDRRPFTLSMAGLVAGVIALGLASIPAIALERALPNPFSEPEAEKPRPEPPPEREGGITLKYKNFSVNIGGETPEKEPIAEAEPEPELTRDPIRWFTISAIGCALVGLVLASYGQIRERHTGLTVGSMSCCAAAITWQYFAIGIAVGAAAAAFLIVLAILGSALN
jgi:hypothetical protein